MLFARRRWAIRIAEKAGLSVRSPEATLLINLTLFGARELSRTAAAATGHRPPKIEFILLTAMRLVGNSTAINEVARVLQIESRPARSLLLNWRHAALELAAEYGFGKLVDVALRDAY
jgi:hypothetical protein